VSRAKSPKSTADKKKLKKGKDGEMKVREIISKNSNKIASEPSSKKESKGFSLEDVRNILSKKKKESKKEQSKSESTSKVEKVSKAKEKKGSSKVKKLTTASVDDILGFGSSFITPATKPIRDPKKVPKEWQSFYDDLMSLRASLKGALGERSSETIGSSARESSGELSLNSSDAGTETFDRDVALSMVANEQEALNEIEEAIDRIFDGSFGVCQETQKPIKKNRLKAVPFTRFSLEGQDLYEKRKIREGGSTTGAFATLADSTLGTEE
jgi:RNA polymerase-binding transcription factor DksA